ncbi:polyprenyl synthetase family protein [Gleimia sp. 6138-11-ORH1]|uniref:polyprenyl synthetase family protein n=1 Tax=Gleimia sp. 6138-11-ORH1 TaxID=2973937 RepID=UPI0021678817|nr:polyprenyl synthetase family protein [Gleimia sp. 6138-11-ORH1]MCS4484444.1 polyprenyl synthetase family protein [Gleimia sp. 6138-11-ORH1]
MDVAKVPGPTLIDLPQFSSAVHQRTLELASQLAKPYEKHPEFNRFKSLVDSYLGEGKTLRALGVSVGAFLAEGSYLSFPPDGFIRDLGVAMEFYQASALVHDDLIDKVDLRRNHQTIQVAAGKFLPPAAADATAVLVGDYLLSLTHAVANLALAEKEAQLATQLHDYIAGITAEVAWGQYLDILTESHPLTDPQGLKAHVLDVITVKSGRYSVMHPLVLGALAVGGSADLISALQTAGTAWGLAFQMRDDEIGIFSEESVSGKSVSSDISEGKRTVLLALTLERASAAQKDTLLAALGNREVTASQILAVQEIIHATGAYQVHEELIGLQLEKGFAAFGGLSLDTKHQQVLQEFANLLVNRRY